MKFKILIPTMLLTLMFGLTNCSKSCESEIAACSETEPTDELCEAYFQRWFYDKEENKCEKIGYSGCSQKGFATEEECEACDCK